MVKVMTLEVREALRQGHLRHYAEHPMTDETKAKISRSNKGKAKTLELEVIRRIQISANSIGKHNHNGWLNPMFGKHHSDHTKKLIADTVKGNSNAKGAKHPKLAEYNRTHIRRGADHPNYGTHIGAGIPKSPEWKAKISQTRIARGLSKGDKNPMAKEENVAKYFKSLASHPSKPELLIDGILQRHFPNEFKYNGDFSQGVMIAGLIPDFVNINSRKQVIEVFGDLFHNPNIAKGKLKWHRTELGRIMAYNGLSFKCLILWEHDINSKTEEELVNKIKAFIGGYKNGRN